MRYELVSLKICPFVQRAVITLLHKRIPFTLTHIDPADPPDWFRALSPTGKVPLLRVDGDGDGDGVLFESTVIVEYLDEVSPPSLHPSDPLARAQNRAWIEYGSGLVGGLYKLVSATTGEEYAIEHARFNERLERVEATLGDGPFFNGTGLSLVDVTYAPLFMRLALLEEAHPVLDRARLPKVAAWSTALLALPEVRDSVVAEFPALYRAFVARLGAWSARLFVPELATPDRAAP